jgi:uncharacterized membrane protein YkoI
MTKRRTMMMAGLSIATVITGGALTAAALPAMAETTSSTSSSATATTPTATADPSTGRHQANGITETELTGDTAAKVKAAVLAKYPDVTIQRLETDADGGAYEAHVLQADGTSATVTLDDTFAVTGLEAGGHGGGHRGDRADDSTSTDDSTASGT